MVFEKGNIPHNKGKFSDKNGKTYLEIYGNRAKEEIEKRKTTLKKTYKLNPDLAKTNGEKISKSLIGKYVGKKHPNYEKKFPGKGHGRITSEKTKLKLRNIRLGKSWGTHTIEYKNKMSALIKGKNNPMKKEEVRKKVSGSMKGKFIGKNNPFYGKRHDYETRIKMNKSHFKNSDGILNDNWYYGKSFEPYTKEFNKQFKNAIKERDGCCMLCNIGIEDLKLLKRRISIHHINYDKLNSFPQNCITMCNSCHSKVNFNRTQWIVFFQSILKDKYNYKYSEDQKIIFNFTNQEKGGVTNVK